MNKRIEILDGIRGFCILVVIFYHGTYDLVAFLDAPSKLLYNPFMNFVQVFFAGLFVVLCGVSCNFSKNNIKRGAKLALIAIIISLATYFLDNSLFVIFGIIHFLAFCTLSYGLIQNHYQKLRFNGLFPIILLILFIILRPILDNATFDITGLSILGFRNPNFYSSDYFPIIPWIFLFYIGIYFGEIIKNGKFPKWFYDIKCPKLAFLGNKTLIIYILHQPILMAIMYGILYIR